MTLRKNYRHSIFGIMTLRNNEETPFFLCYFFFNNIGTPRLTWLPQREATHPALIFPATNTSAYTNPGHKLVLPRNIKDFSFKVDPAEFDPLTVSIMYWRIGHWSSFHHPDFTCTLVHILHLSTFWFYSWTHVQLSLHHILIHMRLHISWKEEE